VFREPLTVQEKPTMSRPHRSPEGPDPPGSVPPRRLRRGELGCHRVGRPRPAVDQWPPPRIRFRRAPTDYKALVCIFMFGGNDANNFLVPMEDTTTGYQAYTAARQNPLPAGCLTVTDHAPW